MRTDELLASLPTGARETTRWALAQVRSDTPETDPEQIARFVAKGWRNPLMVPGGLRRWRDRLGPFEEQRATQGVDGVVEVAVACAKGRTWILRFALDAESLLASTSMLRPAPPGVTIRPVADGDWEELTELEAACPTQTSDGSSASLHRGAHLRDHFALQKEIHMLVAEEAGRIVGARAFTVREVEIDGVATRYAYSHFARILPSHQSKGLFQPLNAGTIDPLQPSLDGIFAYRDPRNDAMLAALGSFPTWGLRVFRAELPCAGLAGEAFGRAATPDDAEHIAALMNRCHGREGFFAPYTAETLRERLSRAPDAYSWSNLFVSDAAVVGAWLCGERRRVEKDGRRSETSRGLVLDFGFEGGVGLDELERLLRHTCAAARDAGMDQLSVFSSPPSQGAERIRELADDVVSYEFAFGAPEPPDLAECGAYVDPVYF